MQAIAIEIFEVCMFFAIAMEIEWLPRSQNDKQIILVESLIWTMVLECGLVSIR